MKVSLTTFGLLAVMAGSLEILPEEHVSHATVEKTFVIDEDFTCVRKILVRSDSTKQIVAMADIDVLDQKWDRVNVSLAKLFRKDWNVGAKGRLLVRTHDPYVGEENLTLLQNVDIKRDELLSETSLEEGTDRLRDYACRVACERAEDGRTLVTARIHLSVAAHVTPLANRYVDYKVQEAAQTSLARMEACFREVIAEHQGRDLPLRLPPKEALSVND